MRRLRLSALLCLTLAIPPTLTAQDKALPWKLVPLFAVGGADDSILVLSSLSFRDVAALSGNGVALVDRVENQVVILNPVGRVVRRLGRNGAGPGELGFPTALAVAPNGDIWVWDAKRPGLVGFGTEGSPLPPRANPPGIGLVQSLQLLSDNDLVVLRSRRDSLTLMRVSGDSPQILARLARPAAQSVPAGSCAITDYGARPVFSPDLVWAARGNAVAINTESSFTIRIEGGPFSGTVSRPDAQSRIATASLAKRALGQGIPIMLPGRNRPCFIDSDDVLKHAGFELLVPAYHRLVFTAEDTLWAIRYTLPGEPAIADVFGLPSGYIGTVALGHASPVAARDDGSIVSIEVDVDDVPRLVVYKIEH